MVYGRRILTTAILLTLLVLSSSMMSTQSTAKEADIIVDTDGTGDYTTIQKAVNNANNGSVIKIKRGIYNSVDIGTCSSCSNNAGQQSIKRLGETDDDDFGEPLSVELRAYKDQFVRIHPATATAEAGIEIANNGGKEVVIEGIVFQDAEYGVAVKTASDVTLRRNAFMNSLNNDILLLNNKFGNIKDTIEVEDKGNFWGTEREEVYFPTDLGESSRYLEYNKEDGFEPEKILQSKRTETLRVDFITGDNYNFQNKYKTLGKAVDHAKSDSTIKVEATEFGKTSEEHYGPVEIAGEGVSENYNLTIVGVAERRAGTIKKLPRLSSLTFSSDGMYTVRNFIIKGEISSVSSNSVVRAQKNDWGGNPYGRLAVIEESGGIVSAYPFCETRSCDEYVSGENSPYCMVVNTPRTDNAGCENKDKNKITVDASGLQSMDATDRFKSTIEVSGDVSRQTTVSLTIYPSDSLEKKTVTLTPQQNSKEVEIKSYFRSTTLGQQVTPALRVSTKDYNPTSMAVYQSTKLSSYSDSGSGSDSDLFEEESSSSATESTAESKVRQNIINTTRRNTTTPVSQFNDGDDVTERYESELIPPTSATTDNPATGNVVTEGVRTFRQTTTFGGRGSLIKSNDENRYRIGTSHTSIPSADSHVLVIQYTLSPDIDGESIEAKIVNQQNEVISPQRKDITLKSSVSGSETIVVQLTQREIDYINNIGNAYVVYDGSINTNKGSSMSLYSQIILSGTSISEDIQRTDEFSNTVFNRNSDLPSEEPDDPAGEQVQDPPELENTESRDSTMTIDYFVEGTKSQFNTYDVAPKEFSNSAQSELRMTFTIRNTGDRSITKDVKIVDKWHHPESPQHYPNRESRVDMNINTETKKNFEVSLGPSETITKTVVMDWSKTKFGYHNLTVKKSNNQEYLELVGANKIEAYVLQPPTFEVSGINDVPQSQLTYSNFDSSVDVVNIGDLGGKRTVKLNFVDWSTTEDIKLSGGNPRIGRTSSVSTISYGSEENANQEQIQNQYRLEYAPLDEAVPVSGTNRNWFENSITRVNNFVRNDELFRPYSPFHTEPGTYELIASVTNQNIEVTDNIELNSGKREDVELYELQITGLQVNTVGDEDKFESRPSESEVKSYASAYPYTYRSKKATRGGNDVRGFGTMYSIPESGTGPISRAARPMGTGPFTPFTKLKQHSSNDFPYAGYNSNVNKKCNADAGNIPIIPTSSDSSSSRLVCNGEGSGIKYIQSPRLAEGGATEITFGQNSPINGGNAQTYKDSSTLYARVGIQNPLKDSPAVGRVEIVSNRPTNERGKSVGLGVSGASQPKVGNDNFDKEVVGSAAVRVPAQSTKYVDVPIVIKNDKGVGGTHILEVRARHKEDYIGKSDSAVTKSKIPKSPITRQHHSQFKVPVKIETYGDTILTDFGPQKEFPEFDNNNYNVNEVCTSNLESGQPDRRKAGITDNEEGINPVSGEETNSGVHLGFVESDGNCIRASETATDTSTARFASVYENLGGETQTIDGDGLSQFKLDTAVDSIHEEQSIQSADKRFSQHDLSTGINSVTISPQESKKLTLSKRYREPGEYRALTRPCRQVSDKGPQIYDLQGFAGVYRNQGSMQAVETVTAPSESEDSQFIQDAFYHGGQGCESTSVEVYDTTEPQPDFTIASDEVFHKREQQASDYQGNVQKEKESINIKRGDYIQDDLGDRTEYWEGRMLAFTGASCSYAGPITYTVNGQEPCMTVDNVDITELDWTITNKQTDESKSPNYDGGCKNVNRGFRTQSLCVQDTPTVSSGQREEVAHRFYDAGINQIELQASDNSQYTEGSSNQKTSQTSVSIKDDNSIPTLTPGSAIDPTQTTKTKTFTTSGSLEVRNEQTANKTMSNTISLYSRPREDTKGDTYSVDTVEKTVYGDFTNDAPNGFQLVSEIDQQLQEQKPNKYLLYGHDVGVYTLGNFFVRDNKFVGKENGVKNPTFGEKGSLDRVRAYLWEGKTSDKIMKTKRDSNTLSGYKNCAKIRKAASGTPDDGAYEIDPDGDDQNLVSVQCRFTPDKSWTGYNSTSVAEMKSDGQASFTSNEYAGISTPANNGRNNVLRTVTPLQQSYEEGGDADGDVYSTSVYEDVCASKNRYKDDRLLCLFDNFEMDIGNHQQTESRVIADLGLGYEAESIRLDGFGNKKDAFGVASRSASSFDGASLKGSWNSEFSSTGQGREYSSTEGKPAKATVAIGTPSGGIDFTWNDAGETATYSTGGWYTKPISHQSSMYINEEIREDRNDYPGLEVAVRGSGEHLVGTAGDDVCSQQYDGSQECTVGIHTTNNMVVNYASSKSEIKIGEGTSGERVRIMLAQRPKVTRTLDGGQGSGRTYVKPDFASWQKGYLWVSDKDEDLSSSGSDSSGDSGSIGSGVRCCSDKGVTNFVQSELISERRLPYYGRDSALSSDAISARDKYPATSDVGKTHFANETILPWNVKDENNFYRNNSLGGNSNYAFSTYEDINQGEFIGAGGVERLGRESSSNLGEVPTYTATATTFADKSTGYRIPKGDKRITQFRYAQTYIVGADSKRIEYPSLPSDKWNPVNVEIDVSWDDSELSDFGASSFGNSDDLLNDTTLEYGESTAQSWQGMNNPPVSKIYNGFFAAEKTKQITVTAEKSVEATGSEDIDDAENGLRAARNMFSYEYMMDQTRSSWRERSSLDGSANYVKTDNDGAGGNDIRLLSSGPDNDNQKSYITDTDPGRFLDDDEDHLVFHRNGYSGDSDVLPYGADYGGKFEGTDLCFGMNPQDDEIGVTEIKWNGFTDSGVHAYDKKGDKKCIEYKEDGGQRTDTLGVQVWDAAQNTVDHELDVTVYHDSYAPEVLNFDGKASASSPARHNIHGRNGPYYDNNIGTVYAANPSNNFAGGSVSFRSTAEDDEAPESSNEYDVGLACLDIVKGNRFTGDEGDMRTCEKKITDSSGYSNTQEQEVDIDPSWNMREIDVDIGDYSSTRNTQEFTSHATDLHSNNDNKDVQLEVVVDQKNAKEINSNGNTATTNRGSHSGSQKQCRTYEIQGPGDDSHGVGVYSPDTYIDKRVSTDTDVSATVNSGARSSARSSDSNDIPKKPDILSYQGVDKANVEVTESGWNDGEKTICAEVEGHLAEWRLNREAKNEDSVRGDSTTVRKQSGYSITNSGTDGLVNPPDHQKTWPDQTTYSMVLSSSPSAGTLSNTKTSGGTSIIKTGENEVPHTKTITVNNTTKTVDIGDGVKTVPVTGPVSYTLTSTITGSIQKFGDSYYVTASRSTSCSGGSQYESACPGSPNYPSVSISGTLSVDYRMAIPKTTTVQVPPVPSGYKFDGTQVVTATNPTRGSSQLGDEMEIVSYQPSAKETLDIRTYGDRKEPRTQDQEIDSGIGVGSCVEMEAGIDVKIEDYHGNVFTDNWAINEHYENGENANCFASTGLNVDERSSAGGFPGLGRVE